MAVFHVVEKFVSINGEGQHAGELAVFVRLRGCNLKCSYCDTRWACTEDAKAEEMTEVEIVSYVISTGVKRVTLTGGEPLLADNVIDLLEAFAVHKDIFVEIETNGSVDIHPFAEIDNPPAFTLDYKLEGSGMEDRMLIENFKYLSSKDTVKFVCSDVSELDKVCEIVDKYRISDKCTALISPVFGRIEPADMVDYLITHKRNDIRLQLQLHKFIWNPNKRGV
ncbi:MAG: putative 7-carboxy-7-deazaguanine synthase QueE [Pseudobutyrivibrio sp.]|nr:putative 7-carboxy-7-deazaguanine synthase QueE [Pseudobutyrivibrio sp.]